MSGFDSFCVAAAAVGDGCVVVFVVVVVALVVVVFACSYFCSVTCFVSVSETQKERLRDKGGRDRELEGVAKEKKTRERG